MRVGSPPITTQMSVMLRLICSNIFIFNYFILDTILVSPLARWSSCLHWLLAPSPSATIRDLVLAYVPWSPCRACGYTSDCTSYILDYRCFQTVSAWYRGRLSDKSHPLSVFLIKSSIPKVDLRLSAPCSSCLVTPFTVTYLLSGYHLSTYLFHPVAVPVVFDLCACWHRTGCICCQWVDPVLLYSTIASCRWCGCSYG